MKKRIVLPLAVMLAALLAAPAAAQSAQKVSQMLATERVTWGQAAYFSVTAQGAADGTTEQSALETLVREKTAPNDVTASDEITLEQFALVCARTWSIQGSLWLLKKPTARYALRQMKADGVVQQSADPHKKLSGHEALAILTSCILTYGGDE